MSRRWTTREIAAEAEKRAAYEATGMCPDSGYPIGHCWTVDLCDCAYDPPDRCSRCGVYVWDLAEHERRQHPRTIEELIERSSLGTPAAKTARASADPEQVQRILRRVRELEAEGEPP